MAPVLIACVLSLRQIGERQFFLYKIWAVSTETSYEKPADYERYQGPVEGRSKSIRSETLRVSPSSERWGE